MFITKMSKSDRTVFCICTSNIAHVRRFERSDSNTVSIVRFVFNFCMGQVRTYESDLQVREQDKGHTTNLYVAQSALRLVEACKTFNPMYRCISLLTNQVTNFYGSLNDEFSQPRSCWHPSGQYIYSVSSVDFSYYAIAYLKARIKNYQSYISKQRFDRFINLSANKSDERTNG